MGAPPRLDLAPRRTLALLLIVTLSGDGAAPRSAQRLDAATLKPLESAEAGLEEKLRAALGPPAAPIHAQAVPGGPGPPGTGLEEGEQGTPGKISRRTFFQWLQAATATLTGTPSARPQEPPSLTPEIADLLAGTLQEAAGAIRQAPRRLTVSVIKERAAVARLVQEWQLSDVAAVLQALQAYRLPNGRWRKGVESSQTLVQAERALRDAAVQWEAMSDRSWRKGDREAVRPLLRAALGASGQFEHLFVLNQLATVLDDRVPMDLVAEYRRAQAANLATDDAWTAHLQQRVTALIGETVKTWEREAQQELSRFGAPVPPLTAEAAARKVLEAARIRATAIARFEDDWPDWVDDPLHELFDARQERMKAELWRRIQPSLSKQLMASGIPRQWLRSNWRQIRTVGFMDGWATSQAGWLDIFRGAGLRQHLLWLVAAQEKRERRPDDPRGRALYHTLSHKLIFDKEGFTDEQVEDAVRADEPVAFLRALVVKDVGTARRAPGRAQSRRRALTPAPWHRLANAIARLAAHREVTVRVTTDARGLVQHVVWSARDFERRADDEDLVSLRAAPWLGLLRVNHAYTTTLPQGTRGPAIGRRLATLSASTWAAAPVRVVPGGPGPPGTGAGPSAGLRAGMEEGQGSPKKTWFEVALERALGVFERRVSRRKAGQVVIKATTALAQLVADQPAPAVGPRAVPSEVAQPIREAIGALRQTLSSRF